MVFKCVVIDDEQYAATAISRYVDNMPNLMLVNTYTDPIVALAEISVADQIDFIFLDIEMPVISGLELARNLRDKAQYLIFITSHDEHALEAFNLKANHYLLKPLTFSKFALTVNAMIKDHSKVHNEKQLRLIKAGQKNSYHQVNFNEIISVKALKNYVVISTAQEDFLTHLGLNQIEEELSEVDFIRISRSHIIAKEQIRKIEGNLVKLKNNEVFQVGETYKPRFLKWIKANVVVDKH